MRESGVMVNPAAFTAVAFVCGMTIAAPNHAETATERLFSGNLGMKLRLSDELNSAPPVSQLDDQADVEVSGDPPLRSRRNRGRLREFRLRLTFKSEFDNNIRRTNTGQLRDTLLILKPQALLQTSFGKHKFILGAEGTLARYEQFGSEDYRDFKLNGEGTLDLSRRFNIKPKASVTWGHDPRGSTLGRLVGSNEPDLWRRHDLDVDLVFGRSISRAQLTWSIGLNGTRYLNNNQSIRDIDTAKTRLKGRWRFGHRLSVVGELGRQDTKHVDPTSTLDDETTDFLIGIAWEATAKTTGEVKFGKIYKAFVDPSQTDFSGNSWDARVNWEPKPYSKFTGYSSRSVQESAQPGGGSTTSDLFGLRWQHGFTERLSLKAGSELTTSAFGGGRDDDEINLDVGLAYQLTRWLQVEGGYSQSERKSTIPGVGYDAQVWMLNLTTDFAHKFTREKPNE